MEEDDELLLNSLRKDSLLLIDKIIQQSKNILINSKDLQNLKRSRRLIVNEQSEAAEVKLDKIKEELFAEIESQKVSIEIQKQPSLHFSEILRQTTDEIPNTSQIPKYKSRSRTKSKAVKPKVKTCQVCRRQVQHVRAHMKYMHGAKTKCKLCKKLISKISMRQHMIEVHKFEKNFKSHTKGRKLETCEYCKKTRLHMAAHMNYAHGPKVNCPRCFKSVPEIYLNGHISVYHA